ncbi:MAG TPA: lysozyme inhibitor LprI family protein [Trichocoleus sp.]
MGSRVTERWTALVTGRATGQAAGHVGAKAKGPAQSDSSKPIWAASATKGIAGGLAGVALMTAAGALPAPAAEATQAESAAPGVAAPYCPDQTQQGLNHCTAIWLKTAEYLESLVYEDLRQSLDLSERVQLAIAEEHWQAFRQAQCEMESEPFKEGSIYPLIYGSCMAQTTNDRTADLQEWGNAELPAATAEANLQGLLAQQNWADSEAQKRWEAYRNLQCDFEANYRDDRPEQYRQCVSRLTQTRILRLQALADQPEN